MLALSRRRRAAFLLFCAVLACWFIGAGFWVADNPWTLDNDHLAPLDYLGLVFSRGMDFKDILHARIPSLFPDFVIQGLAMSWSGVTLAAFSWAYLLQLGAGLGLAFLLSVLLSGVSEVKKIFSFSLVLVVVLLVPSVVRDTLFLSGFPARHGGNWINTALAMSLSIVLLGGRLGGWKKAGAWFALSAVVASSVFSNRLFVVSYVMPWLVSLLAASTLAYVSGRSGEFGFSINAKRFVPSLLLGSALGFLGYLAVMHQCHEVGTVFTLERFSVNFQYLASNGGLVFYLLPPLLFVIRSLGDLRAWGTPKMSSVYSVDSVGLFSVWLSAYFGLIAFCALKTPLPGSDGIRYLIFSSYAVLILLGNELGRVLSVLLAPAGCLSKGSGSSSHSLFRFSGILATGGWSLLGGAFILLASLWSAHGELVSSYSESYKGRIDWLSGSLKEAGLTGSTGYVVNPPWNSRVLQLLLPGGSTVLTVSSDGNPFLFHHSRTQFVKSGDLVESLGPGADEVVAPSWVLTAPHERGRMYRYFGEPLARLSCFAEGECLYVFDSQKTARNTSTFLSSWQADYYGCLEIGSRLESFRSWLKRRVGMR